MTELTNAIRKQVASLDNPRHRKELGLFKAEGTKCVAELTPHFDTVAVYATRQWLDEHPHRQAVECATRDIERMSAMVTPPGVIAVMRIPETAFNPSIRTDNLLLALDAIRDPGNLGTIIRIADWFGIDDIICSTDTTDCYSPKVVQATMGSLARVKVHYVDLPATLQRLASRMPVYGTFLDGESIYSCAKEASGVIIIGNESHGINDTVAQTVTRRITIPSYPHGAPTAESLNAAVATAVTVSAFRESLWQRKI